MTHIVEIASDLAFPEGPTVDADGSIWVSELRGSRIGRIDTHGGIERYAVGGAPNGTALGADGSLWFCDAERNQVRRLDPATGQTETMVESVDGEALAAPNDLTFHPSGDLVFSCPGTSRREPTGYVCRRTPDGTVDRIADGLLFPNGVTFSHEGERLYVAETYDCRVLSGAWARHIDFAPALETPGPIGADGVAVTADGTLCTAVYGAGLIRIQRPGKAPRDIALPDDHPAGCAVDPLGRWDVLVTGTQTGVLLGITL